MEQKTNRFPLCSGIVTDAKNLGKLQKIIAKDKKRTQLHLSPTVTVDAKNAKKLKAIIEGDQVDELINQLNKKGMKPRPSPIGVMYLDPISYLPGDDSFPLYDGLPLPDDVWPEDVIDHANIPKTMLELDNEEETIYRTSSKIQPLDKIFKYNI